MYGYRNLICMSGKLSLRFMCGATMALFGSETWSISPDEKWKLAAFEVQCYRKTLKITD